MVCWKCTTFWATHYYQQISNCCKLVLTYWQTDWRRQWLTDCWSCTALCSNIIFFVTAVVYSGSWNFLYGWCEYLFVSELNNAYFTRQIFQNSFWVTYFLHGSLTQLLLELDDFLPIDISQGSIVACLRCGGTLKYQFITNVLLSPSHTHARTHTHTHV